MRNLQVAGALNVGFYLISALLLWPAGKAGFSWALGKGYLLFWLVLVAVVLAGRGLQRIFRMKSDPPSRPYILLNLLLSVAVQTGWSAFTALTARSFALGASWWLAAVIFLLGFVAAYLALLVVQGFFSGSLYRMAAAVATVVAYPLFALWPAGARLLFEWFFQLFS